MVERAPFGLFPRQNGISMKQDNKFNMLSFTGKMKILHLSWMAFFITFVVWFNHAPLLGSIAKSLDISMAQVKTRKSFSESDD